MSEELRDNTEKSEIAQKEEQILAFWSENNIFEKSLSKDAPKGDFVFYEGPPTANAKPALHHLEARVFKDIIPRFKTMQGFRVRRKGGWDTHGLPVELQIEKKLGLKSKKEIELYGVEKFNKECKDSVFDYISDWEKFTDRIGYWVDKKNAYYTFDTDYIESVWNILKTVDEKKLLYKDYKVLPWCPRCGTALSSHELAQGYQDDKDLSVTAKFKVVGQDNTYILAWTTTPWTLPGNVALAVGRDIEYVKIKVGNDYFILAKERLSVVTDSYEMVEEIKGENLVGLTYEPLYSFLSQKFAEKNPEAFAKAYQVYPADFVTTTDGTGVVHTAVMYGQEDFDLGTNRGLPKYHVVKDDGNFLDDMDFLSGRFVKDEEVAVDIIKDLAHRGFLFKKEKYEHSYPHCWRCKTPLIYYARDSWYIKMSALRAELVAENEGINWEPSHIKEGRFGEWLREIKDWAISRERYWGTPLPIWSDAEGNYRVVGSVDEFKKLSKKSGNKYFVMRHGETEGNVKHIWNIDSNVPNLLTEKGKEQVRENVKYLKDKKIDVIIVSPFGRTQETASIVIENLGLSRDIVVIDPRIGEWNVGDNFNGKPVEEFFVTRNTSADRYEFKNDGGESYKDVLRRSGDFMYDIDTKYAGKNILIVSHGAVTRGISLVAQGFSFRKMTELSSEFENFNNAEVREVDFVPLPHNREYEVDLHKPYIDEVVLVDEEGKELTRVKEVMDVWFDSGSMPFAQDHYPWQKESHLYPADFISEAIDQTRGWFYTLHAIGVLMGKGRAYKNVICLGHILDSQGKKMSKSIGNIVEPWAMMNTYGVDALRLWMYTVNSPGDSKNFDEKTVDEIVKKVFNPILNIVVFYELYKNDSITPHNKSQYVLDTWILSRLYKMIHEGTTSLEKFQVFESARSIRDFVNDFSAWYVRRSRDRFKSENAQEKSDALSTTAYVLLELSKYMAPFAPFFAESVFQKVKVSGESVHLENWPESQEFDEMLLDTMDKVREVVTSALELRQKAGHKVRQPLQRLTIKNKELGILNNAEILEVIQDEINVKEIVFDDTIAHDVELDTHLTDDLKQEGVARSIIRAIQDARKTEGLNPSDTVSLVFSVDDEIKKVIEKYTEMITKPTGARSVEYSPEPQKYEVSIEGGACTFSI